MYAACASKESGRARNSVWHYHINSRTQRPNLRYLARPENVYYVRSVPIATIPVVVVVMKNRARKAFNGPVFLHVSALTSYTRV